MRLYHVTSDVLNPVVKTFNPLVPDSKSDIEDAKTPRVCLSTDIEHCIQAISAVDILEKNRLIRVYTYDMGKDDWRFFLPPYYLWKSGKVFDAMHTHEVWCLKSLIMNSSVYRINNFECEMVIDWYAVNCVALRSLIRDRFGINPVGSTSQSMYTHATRLLEHQKRYDDSDDLYESIVTTFPCQAHSVKSIDLALVDERQLSKARRELHKFYIDD